MDFKKKNIYQKTGKILGYMVFYLIFTIILFFILKLTGKFPENWRYIHLIPLTLFIFLLGQFIDLSLK